MHLNGARERTRSQEELTATLALPLSNSLTLGELLKLYALRFPIRKMDAIICTS